MHNFKGLCKLLTTVMCTQDSYYSISTTIKAQTNEAKTKTNKSKQTNAANKQTHMRCAQLNATISVATQVQRRPCYELPE